MSCTPEPPTGLTLDATAIKVLAHPLRARLLSALRRDGAATATDLAGRLGTNSGATSYHLRKLESVGLVTDTGEGQGKRRLWRASTDFHSFTASEFAQDEDTSTAADWLLRHYVHQLAQDYERWLDVSSEWPKQWRDASGSSDYLLRLTAAQAQALHDEVSAVFDKYRRLASEDPEARRVAAWFVISPNDLDT